MVKYNDVLERALGIGGKFPEMFSNVHGGVRLERGRDKIKQSIADILGTRLGERVMMPEYGSRLYEVVFELNDRVAADLARLYIKEALQRWEDRIVLEDIYVNIAEENDHRMNILISYRINRSNIRDEYRFRIFDDGTFDL